MKKFYSLLILVLVSSFNSHSQVSSDYAVMLSATTTENPPSITLHWGNYPSATGYTVYRKKKIATSWGSSIGTLTGSDTAFTDNNVMIDSGYEYKVRRTSSVANAEGYLYSAVRLRGTDYRGKCLLIVDTTITSSMETELFRLMKDISGDGWQVKRIDVSRNDSVMHVKNLIVNEYNNDPDVKSVLLFGHVPVPYAGNINPDGHPDHVGAWPFDAFYGDMDGEYTDDYVDNSTASRQENWNVPGDGKFDDSYFESDIVLQVGRVDMANLPSFPDSESALLKKYLDKDHDFRNGNFSAAPRGLIDDNFGAFSGEAFASVGWRSFAPMFGDTAVHELDYFSTLQTESYLWSYGCGGGWYQGASGVGSTMDFVNDTVHGVFSSLFGSYFGDWDATDDFLRAALASNGYTLTSCWAGRPYWHFHHMALGENIGFSAALSQNNCTTYMSNICCGWIHIALMGDPTLRMNIIKPASDLELSTAGENEPVELSWTATNDNILGYYVYRSHEEFGKYLRISDTIVTAASFTDFTPENGTSWYMIRAVRLEETPSGSYYNLSEGISDSLSVIITLISSAESENTFSIFPNPAIKQITIESNPLLNDILEISNSNGITLIREELNHPLQSIDVTSLPSGIYFVKWNGKVKKLVIQ